MDKKIKEIEEYKELPYTIFGSTHLPERFVICLTGKGLKKLASLINDKNSVRITFENKVKTKFEILD